ncbi:MAG: phosphocholine cytidylyltransferase family protein, partial [Nitrospirota bacterium]|nr:phosphocholine cytidylyltransferase family protein [Nitrospirota bacterium]
MQAITLAAGYGNRMRPLTLSRHKTMLEIAGRSVIEWIIAALLEHNVTEITVVTGYRAEELQAHLSRVYPNVGVKYVHNDRYAETNNIYSMALALEVVPIHSDVLLIESDLVFDSAVIGRLLASPHPNVALVDRYQTGMDGTVVTIDDQNVITNVIPPHLQGTDFSFTDKYKTLNIYRFSKDFCQSAFNRLLTYYARAIDDNCYYELILGIVIYMQREVVHAAVVRGEEWSEIDDPNDLNMARFMFEKSNRREILDRSFGGYWNYDVLDFCFIRNVYFPSSAVLAELKNNLYKLLQNYGSTQ